MNHETVLRLITLLQLIPNSPRSSNTWTLKQKLIEEGFAPSDRTLQRDLEKLSLGFPIECDDSKKPYKWSLHNDYSNRLPEMDNASALTWALAEEYLTGLLPQVAVDKLKNQFEHAHQILDVQSKNSFSQWRQTVKAIPNGKALIPAEIESDIWQVVTEALLEKKALEVEYLSRKKNKVKSFSVHPIGMVVKHSITYLVAMIKDYDDIRQLALHRIKKATLTESNARTIENFSIDEYINSGAFGYSIEEKETELNALIEPSVAWVLEETPVSHQQELIFEPKMNLFKLKATVPDNDETLWWLMGFGSKVEVVSPKCWREKIYNHALAIVERAQ
ncbi:WYL domain-containing transcriptional regulator [Hydrogenovibrio crunogenus]|uniref:WYL domain-containing transcriptional regulator n=1 Tax=Hydrogenovibrio crunogenus TaxID=39765 RepID=A0A4P7P226_9GAMM|nr:WYL domain-containing protein [Hydrogenovibrio crunogenus]QBZ84177.1 WYL domain-containing transcriptional regulator [Hydrogenovibrio crunogenus]